MVVEEVERKKEREKEKDLKKKIRSTFPIGFLLSFTPLPLTPSLRGYTPRRDTCSRGRRSAKRVEERGEKRAGKDDENGSFSFFFLRRR